MPNRTHRRNEQYWGEEYTKIDETRSQFSEKVNKIDKFLAIFTKTKMERTQINCIVSKRGEITTDVIEI